MIDSGLVAQYKKVRAENPGTSRPLRLALGQGDRQQQAGWIQRPRRFLLVDGFDIEISYGYDDCGDYSHLGEFTSSWEPDAVENPEARHNNHVYRYFVPTTPYREHFDALHKMGMAKSVAHEKALRYVLDAVEEAREYTSFIVTVTASKEGIELGSDVLGGIDEDYIENAVIDHGMIKLREV
jgi:hypothetical protein